MLAEARPLVESEPLGRDLLQVLHALSNKPVLFSRFGRAFAHHAGQNPSGQEALFAVERRTPAEALRLAAAEAGVELRGKS